MTLNELKHRVSVRHASGDYQYDVEITYRGKQYKCKSINNIAWNRLDDDYYADNHSVCGYTNKEAWKAFYDECKRKNGLGEYK